MQIRSLQCTVLHCCLVCVYSTVLLLPTIFVFKFLNQHCTYRVQYFVETKATSPLITFCNHTFEYVLMICTAAAAPELWGVDESSIFLGYSQSNMSVIPH